MIRKKSETLSPHFEEYLYKVLVYLILKEKKNGHMKHGRMYVYP